jgi:hypothetical protein
MQEAYYENVGARKLMCHTYTRRIDLYISDTIFNTLLLTRNEQATCAVYYAMGSTLALLPSILQANFESSRFVGAYAAEITLF